MRSTDLAKRPLSTRTLRHPLGKPVLFMLLALPLVGLGWTAVQGGLGANPIETLTHETGQWGLRLLVLGLAITPLRRVTGWNDLIRYRRMVGLFSFFYVSLHLSTYMFLDQFFDWQAIWEDVYQRPYITVGFSAFLLLLPLAVTSTNGWIRRLGRNWTRLHRLVYPAAILAVTHFIWLVKADLREPAVYAGLLGLLLGFRLLPRRWQQPARRRRTPMAGRPGAAAAP